MSREDTRRRSRLIRRSAIFTTVVLAGVLYFERPAPAWKPGGLLEYWVSQAAHGRAGQVRIETGISLLNISNTISSVTIFSHDLIGTPLNLLAGPGDQATSSLGLTIPPGGTATVRSLNDDPDTINSGWYGIFSGNDKVLVQTEFSIFQLAFQSQEVQDNKAAPQTQHESLITRAQVPGRDLVQAGSFFVGSEGRIGSRQSIPAWRVPDLERPCWAHLPIKCQVLICLTAGW